MKRSYKNLFIISSLLVSGSAAGADVTFIDEPFTFLTQGSEASPVLIELDELNNIPESMIGEKNYGFGGYCLFSIDGAVLMKLEYDNEWGEFWSPAFPDDNNYTLTFEAKAVGGYDEDELRVYVAGQIGLAEKFFTITDRWEEYTLKINAAGVHTSSGKLQVVMGDQFDADIAIRNFKLTGETAALLSPKALPYTGFTGTSFTAHWEPVEGAKRYLFSCGLYNMADNTFTPFITDEAVEGTEYEVTGLTPGEIYGYWVVAVNETLRSSNSNTILVADLPDPANLTAVAEDLTGVDVSWSAVPGANSYQVTLRESVHAEEEREVTLVDADLTKIIVNIPEDEDFTMFIPYEPEEFTLNYGQLPGWIISMPALVPGGVGFWDNPFAYELFGYAAYMSSGVMDLSGARNGELNVEIDAASGFENGLYVGLFTYNPTTMSYDQADTYTIEKLTPEFTTYSFTLMGGNNRSILQFINLRTSELDPASFYSRIRLTATVEAGKTVSYPVAVDQTEETSLRFIRDLDATSNYAVNITPFMLDDEGRILIQGATSEDVAVRMPENGLETLDVEEEGAIRYYNLNGQAVNEVRSGGLYIRVSNRGAEKIVVR